MSDSSDGEYYGPPLPPELLSNSTEKLGKSSSGKDSIATKRPTQDVQSSSSCKSVKSAFNSDSEDETEESDFIGPALPPNFKQRSSVDSDKDNEDNTYGPSLPSSHAPQEDFIEENDDAEAYGPALPPDFQKSKPDNTNIEEYRTSIGPLLPPGYSEIGPVLPPRFSQQERDNYETKHGEAQEDAVIGPLPSSLPGSRSDEGSSVAREFELRAQQMKDKLTYKSTESDTKVPVRESWMTQLPPEIGKNFGLTARSFRTSAAPRNEDRSVWTDTPADKVRKEKETHAGQKRKSDVQEYVASGKDKKLAQEINEYNKSKRSVSLLEMHQKKLKEKQKKEEKPKERRPFDRESDLQVHRFDEAQRKALIKRSQDLHTRFDHGHTQSQFL